MEYLRVNESNTGITLIFGIAVLENRLLFFVELVYIGMMRWGALLLLV